VLCERCGHSLGYLPERSTMTALELDGEVWKALAAPEQRYRYCANSVHGVCNWLVPADSGDTLCLACQHNRTIPDLSVAENLARWRRLELAKHRLFYTLYRLNLPVPTREQDAEGLAFDFLADPPAGGKVMTGHDNGLITISLLEADDAERAKLRQAMAEPYRTLLGHFRHEVGHFFWDKLVRDGGRLDEFRAMFGDEREDYGAALQRHYAEGAPPDWQTRLISAYASAHPWEDFAETWAHYLHIVDTLEMAHAFGLKIDPPNVSDAADLETEVDFDPHRVRSARRLIDAWLPLTFAVNSLNRCMGQDDLYPFVMSPPVIDKLGFIHDLVRRQG
jgi:hypothetical protein